MHDITKHFERWYILFICFHLWSKGENLLQLFNKMRVSLDTEW